MSIKVKEKNKTLVVESERLGRTFTFNAMCIVADGENKLLIKHFDLEKIAREYGFVFDCEIVSASPNVICVKGVITDDGSISKVAPWKVARVGEVNTNTYTDEYTTAHPTIKAEQIAFDRCMIQMLGFYSKTYSDTEYENLDYSTAEDKQGEIEYAPTSKKANASEEEEIFEESILDAKSEKTKAEHEEKKQKRGRKPKKEKVEEPKAENESVNEESETEENLKAEEESVKEESIEETLNVDSDAEETSANETELEEEIEDTTEDMSDFTIESDDSEFMEEEMDSSEEETNDADGTASDDTLVEEKSARLVELENTIITFGTEAGKPLKEVSGRFLSFASTIGKNTKHGEMAELIREYISLAKRNDVFMD